MASLVCLTGMRDLSMLCRWEGDEPWNWEERARWAGAEAIARRVGVRRVERTRFVLRLLADRCGPWGVGPWRLGAWLALARAQKLLRISERVPVRLACAQSIHTSRSLSSS